MERLVIVVAVALVALIVAVVVDRRSRPDAPTQPRGSVPTQLDRADFDHADTPLLIAIFTSATCRSCAAAIEMVERLTGDHIGLTEVEASRRPDLHRRYAIDAVPTIVMADADGVVQRAFLGPPTPEELRAAVEEAQRPGSSSLPDAGRLHDDPPR